MMISIMPFTKFISLNIHLTKHYNNILVDNSIYFIISHVLVVTAHFRRTKFINDINEKKRQYNFQVEI